MSRRGFEEFMHMSKLKDCVDSFENCIYAYYYWMDVVNPRLPPIKCMSHPVYLILLLFCSLLITKPGSIVILTEHPCWREVWANCACPATFILTGSIRERTENADLPPPLPNPRTPFRAKADAVLSAEANVGNVTPILNDIGRARGHLQRQIDGME